MRNIWAGALVFISALNSHSQPSRRPKLEPGGFKRLNKRFGRNNTLTNYTPICPACKHTAIGTDSVSSIYDISGNNKYDNEMQAFACCTGDGGAANTGNITKTRKIRSMTVILALKAERHFAIPLKHRQSVDK